MDRVSTPATQIDYLEGLMEGFVAYDADWRMTYMNAAAERLTGRRREDVLGKMWHEAFPHAVGTEVDRMYQRVKGSRSPERIELDYAHYGRWFEISASPLANGGVGVYFQDISARKRAEEALQRANVELLDGARRKDEFLATLAHELRNPLAPISNAVELLAVRGRADPTLEAARRIVERQLRHMVRLVDDLLDVSRITSGKLALRRERVALDAVIEQALETARPHVRGHEFTVSLPAQPVWLDADPVRLAQVFSNILNNACKYTPGGGHIRLTAERDRGAVVVKVRDSGIGIGGEHLPHVFDMFSQAAPALERAQGGLGIGLSLALGLARLHGGTIEARSDGPGEGSEFVVKLPALEKAPLARGPRERRVPSAVRRVLVVDDNVDSADSLAMLLRADGHAVEVAYDGRGATEAVTAFDPDVILLDIGLPGMNGYDACRAIRARPGGEGIVIAALTGWGQEDVQRKSRESGFDAHLVKPVEREALAALLSARPPG